MPDMPTDPLFRTAVWGIAADPALGGQLVLRGGAAMRLVYGAPRPIADLDFVVLDWAGDPSGERRVATVRAVQAALTSAFRSAMPDFDARRSDVLANLHVELGPRLRPIRRLRAVAIPSPVEGLGRPAELLVYHLEDLLAEKLVALLRPPPHHHRAQDVFDVAAAVMVAGQPIDRRHVAATFVDKATAAGSSLGTVWQDLFDDAIRLRVEPHYVFDQQVASGGRPIPFTRAWATLRAWVAAVQAAHR